MPIMHTDDPKVREFLDGYRRAGILFNMIPIYKGFLARHPEDDVAYSVPLDAYEIPHVIHNINSLNPRPINHILERKIVDFELSVSICPPMTFIGERYRTFGEIEYHLVSRYPDTLGLPPVRRSFAQFHPVPGMATIPISSVRTFDQFISIVDAHRGAGPCPK